MLISEPPLEPHVERYTYEECPCCKEFFVFHDEMHGENPDVRYAWWDHLEEHPLCSEECRDQVVEECGWEYEEDMELEEVEQLKREAMIRYE